MLTYYLIRPKVKIQNRHNKYKRVVQQQLVPQISKIIIFLFSRRVLEKRFSNKTQYKLAKDR